MNAKVLVADDSGMMRKIIVHCLSSLGVTDVTEAGDGEQAIERFNAEPFDLVVTDWNMPKKSGLDVLHAVRAKSRSLPVMMITTESEPERVSEAMRAGATGYLSKPIKPAELRKLLARHVAV